MRISTLVAKLHLHCNLSGTMFDYHAQCCLICRGSPVFGDSVGVPCARLVCALAQGSAHSEGDSPLHSSRDTTFSISGLTCSSQRSDLSSSGASFSEQCSDSEQCPEQAPLLTVLKRGNSWPRLPSGVGKITPYAAQQELLVVSGGDEEHACGMTMNPDGSISMSVSSSGSPKRRR